MSLLFWLIEVLFISILQVMFPISFSSQMLLFMNSPQIPLARQCCLLSHRSHSFDQSLDTAPSGTSYLSFFAVKAISQKVFLEGKGNG